ncbi:MAG: VacJ family lipoprotein [Alphaproteobacteria bacterium]|nr:VacJ family lipoprotein [Alphaproteobacteria bacterium]
MKPPPIALHLGRALLVAASLLALSGCSTTGTDETANDPLEGFNRGVFAFNQGFDKAVIKPVAEGYRWALPKPVRDGVKNVLDNLKAPVILANDLMQGQFERAGVTIGRFIVNTTVGLGGVSDYASDIGLEQHGEDFGQTLAVWGFGEGPYLMLPVLGPSNPRDLTGLIADIFLDPLSYVASANDVEYLTGVRTVVRAIDTRSRHIEDLDDLERTSLDFYAALRSLYRQKRDDEILNGATPPLPIIPSYSRSSDPGNAQAAARGN